MLTPPLAELSYHLSHTAVSFYHEVFLVCWFALAQNSATVFPVSGCWCQNNYLHDFYYPRDAMCRAGLCESDVSVCPSVRYSRYCIKTERDSVMISLPSDSPMISASDKVWLVEKSQGVTPSEGDLWDWGGFEQSILVIFRPISCRISETVQDTTEVTIEH